MRASRISLSSLGSAFGWVLVLLIQPAAQGQSLEERGHWGGRQQVAALLEDGVLVGNGNHLVRLDVTDPSAPLMLSESVGLPGLISGIAVDGDYAYVTCLDEFSRPIKGFHVFQINDPHRLELLASINTGQVPLMAIPGRELLRNAAPILDQDSWPSTTQPQPNWQEMLPVEIQPEIMPLGRAISTNYHVSSANGFAYVCTGEFGVQVIDVHVPSAPRWIARVDTPGIARASAPQGLYLYVADHSGGLQVVDISDPRRARRVGSVSAGNAWGVAVEGDYAVVAAGGVGAMLFDLTNPAKPVQRDILGLSAWAYDVAVEGSLVTVATNGGLTLLEINPASELDWRGQWEYFGELIDVQLAESVAWASDPVGGLQMVNLIEPEHPQWLGSWRTSDMPQNVVVQGDYAYIVSPGHGLEVLEIRDPDQPRHVAGLDVGGWGYDLKVRGADAFLSRLGTDTVMWIDISEPTTPTILAQFPTGEAYGLFIAGNLLFVAAGWDGLEVYQIDDPGSVHQVGHVALRGRARAVVVRDGLAFVAVEYSGVQIIDVHAPQMMSEVGWLETAGQAYDLTLADSSLLVADGHNGLLLVDAQQPAAPRLMQTFPTGANTVKVHYHYPYASVLDSETGLYLLDVSRMPGWVLLDLTPTRVYALGLDVADGVIYITESDGLRLFTFGN
ncbi:MAG: hypothetical protein HJJLKODD_01784 [Phycisphaerae bacterium]|nr:hypothetical protein [Phycisphaerae bacterium]